MNPKDCPSLQELRTLALGKSPSSEESRLFEHLETCSACETKFLALQSDEPFLVSLRKASSQVSTEVDLEPLVQRVVALHPAARNEPLIESNKSTVIPAETTSHEQYPIEQPQTDAWPSRIAEYRIDGRLGEGGMSIVLQAVDLRLDRPVALKLIRTDRSDNEMYVQRFWQEGKAIAKLEHPNVVQVFEVAQFEKRPFLALELIRGGSLAEHLDGNPLAPQFSAQLLNRLSQALAYAHEQGVVHRDLKPSNILLRRSDNTAAPAQIPLRNWSIEQFEPKIADFGLAKDRDEQGLTVVGDLLGTPSYIAPDLTYGSMAGSQEFSGDIYSLGAILYELLTGRPPFVGATIADIFEQVRNENAVPPSWIVKGVPRDLETICLKCLAKEPRRRYRTARELADDLRRFLEKRPILARRTGPLTALWRWSRRHPTVAALSVVTGLATLALIVGGAIYQSRLNRAVLSAEESEDNAIQAKDRADQAYHEARSTLEKMLLVVEDGALARVPRLRQLRRRQLEEALRFYQDMAQRPGSNHATRLDAAKAAYAAGKIQEHLEAAPAAKRNLELAKTQLLSLCAEQPNETDCAATLADTLTALSGMSSIPSEAVSLGSQALEILTPFISTQETISSQESIPKPIRSALALAHHRLGTVYMLSRGQIDESSEQVDLNRAIDHSLLAHDLIAQFVQEQPHIPSHRDKLAKLQVNLSVMYMQRPENFEQAEEFHDLAEQTLIEIIEDQPWNISVASDLGILRVNWAFVQEAHDRLEDAISDLADSIERLDPLAQNEPSFGPARDALYRLHGVRAQVLDSKDRFAESVANWRGCLDYATNPNQHQMPYAYALAKSGSYQQAVDQCDSIVDDPEFATNAMHAWYAANIYAVAAARCVKDETLGEPERLKTADDFLAKLERSLNRVEELSTAEQWSEWKAEVDTGDDFEIYRKRRRPGEAE